MGAYSPYLGVREEHLGGVGFLMTCAVTTACITSGHHKGMPHCQCSDATVTPPLCLRETYKSLLCKDLLSAHIRRGMAFIEQSGCCGTLTGAVRNLLGK
jgi:hypothetical protein